MGLVAFRGVVHRELAGTVAMEAVVCMLLFMGIGFVAGWIADYLVRDAVEQTFRARVQWFREGMIEAGYIEPEEPTDPSATDNVVKR